MTETYKDQLPNILELVVLIINVIHDNKLYNYIESITDQELKLGCISKMMKTLQANDKIKKWMAESSDPTKWPILSDWNDWNIWNRNRQRKIAPEAKNLRDQMLNFEKFIELLLKHLRKHELLRMEENYSSLESQIIRLWLQKKTDTNRNKIFRETIGYKWGLINITDKDSSTIQGHDYTKQESDPHEKYNLSYLVENIVELYGTISVPENQSDETVSVPENQSDRKSEIVFNNERINLIFTLMPNYDESSELINRTFDRPNFNRERPDFIEYNQEVVERCIRRCLQLCDENSTILIPKLGEETDKGFIVHKGESKEVEIEKYIDIIKKVSEEEKINNKNLTIIFVE